MQFNRGSSVLFKSAIIHSHGKIRIFHRVTANHHHPKENLISNMCLLESKRFEKRMNEKRNGIKYEWNGMECNMHAICEIFAYTAYGILTTNVEG